MKEAIVICMPLKNAEKTIQNAIQSILTQIGVKRELILLIGNDNSTDQSMHLIQNYLPNPNIQIIDVNFGNVYQVRNYLNQYVREHIPQAVLVGRLDADDVLINETVIKKIEELYDKNKFDVLMCGNLQSQNGHILEWQNHPSLQLLDINYLLLQLLEMSKGNPKAELASCNTFINPKITIDYPNKLSAEDHWFTVFLLLQKNKLKIHIDENLLYCVYSLDGYQTSHNQKKNLYIKSRHELYHYLKNTLDV